MKVHLTTCREFISNYLHLICLAQGETGIQGIKGAKGAQVQPSPNFSAHLPVIFLIFLTRLLLFLQGEKGVKGPKGRVSWDSVTVHNCLFIKQLLTLFEKIKRSPANRTCMAQIVKFIMNPLGRINKYISHLGLFRPNMITAMNCVINMSSQACL